MPALECKNITKIYVKGFFRKKTIAIKDLSFTVPHNTITGFIGSNGAGKTTSIKLLLGLLTPTQGTTYIRDIPSCNPKSRKNVAYVSEQPYFYNHLTVAESLSFASKLYGVSGNLRISGIDKVLDTVKLSDKKSSKIHTLSKGMQQRCNLAHAIIGNPDIYILDEPMSGLDPIGRSLFRNIFKELAQQGKCVFFSTHILEDIESICDSIIALSQGTMAYSGNIKDLISNHTSGTEIIVNKMSDLIKDHLIKQGFTISDITNNNNLIFIPNDKSVQACQDYLLQNNIYPQSIKPRAESIEKILYKNDLVGDTQ